MDRVVEFEFSTVIKNKHWQIISEQTKSSLKVLEAKTNSYQKYPILHTKVNMSEIQLTSGN